MGIKDVLKSSLTVSRNLIQSFTGMEFSQYALWFFSFLLLKDTDQKQQQDSSQTCWIILPCTVRYFVITICCQEALKTFFPPPPLWMWSLLVGKKEERKKKENKGQHADEQAAFRLCPGSSALPQAICWCSPTFCSLWSCLTGPVHLPFIYSKKIPPGEHELATQHSTHTDQQHLLLRPGYLLCCHHPTHGTAETLL